MDDDIDWKEAKSGQSHSNLSEEVQQFDADQDELLDFVEETNSAGESEGEDTQEFHPTSDHVQEPDYVRPRPRAFSYRQINLSLRRNIVALADSNQHKPKPNYDVDSQIEPFDIWLENALVVASPNADILLFSGQCPEKVTFFAKLSMEPVNQYVTKPLEVPLNYNEQVTSLLCLPIMSTKKTAFGLVDWTALVVGLSSGYVNFYTEQSTCLLSLKFCDEPVINLRFQTLKNNSNARSEAHFASIIDELLVVYKASAIVVDGLGLYENLRLANDEVVKTGFTYEPAYNLTNLPSILNCQKWNLDSPRGSLVLDADLLGTRRKTTFDSLVSDSINFENIPVKACARTVAFVGLNPFISCYQEAKESSAHTYTELIGSIFSLWNKPTPSRAQLTEVPKSNSISLFDRERLATTIVSSPDKRLAAVTDDFGRVLLVDATNWIVVRVWKGYRSAQCGWIEVKRNPDELGSPHASFLVIYAPKRGLLEVWSAQRGPRVAAFNVGKSCRLLYSGFKMLNMRAELLNKNPQSNHITQQSYSSHCYLLNAKSETIFCIDLPYTYSLYKHGDLKSRDQLLITELVGILQQNSQVEMITDILDRIALAESLQNCIEKIVIASCPDKIVPIMENLIIRIMKNYDNHAGELMSDDDKSIIELSKRIIRLCTIFNDLSSSEPPDLSLPDVNQRLIDDYEEHPQEIDEFSEQLGWSTSEVLRYLSLLSLERSYRKNHQSNPWPSSGEPLAWPEFISCFDIDRKIQTKSMTIEGGSFPIRLREFNSRFLGEDKIMKTALFIYNRRSEVYYNSAQSNTKRSNQILTEHNKFMDPPSRLALLFKFWLSTKLCNHWKMWAFLQTQVGYISDELKVIAMSHSDDKILIETWKQIYNLILESENLYAAMIATATIKSDTLRMIQDNEKREKLEKNIDQDVEDKATSEKRIFFDWECLCIDAERMSLLSQQLEDVFLLNLLLKYSITEGHLIDNYLYRVPRISVANILRGGPTIVSELVAQWAVQSKINLKLFTEPYGSHLQTETENQITISCSKAIANESSGSVRRHSKVFAIKSAYLGNEEHAKELLHHTKTSFPRSLDSDVVIMNCIWEYCRQWSSNPSTADRIQLLKRAFEGLGLLSATELSHRQACMAFKTFFQRTFESLVLLVETNSTILNVKNARIRDKLTRKELNMGEDCLEDFVQFCCDISEFMLQTSVKDNNAPEPTALESQQQNLEELKDRLMTTDNWWTDPIVVKMFKNSQSINHRRGSSEFSSDYERDDASNSLVRTTLSASNLLKVDFLVELNKLANLMNLIFSLKIVKAYPISLIGEESRQLLQLNLQQQSTVSSGAADNKSRGSSLNDIRYKFARKCILNIVRKLTDESIEFNEKDEEHQYDEDTKSDQIKSKQQHQQQQRGSLFDRKRSESSSNKLAAAKQVDRRSCPQQTLVDKRSIASSNKFDGMRASSNNGSLQHDETDDSMLNRDENNESMVLFGNLLSLATEWQLNCEELYLELVFELYRCNHDNIASQISTRIGDQQTLANGLLKIASQRVLVLFGLSPHLSGLEWRRRSDMWSIFQPNVASWLKSIQQEEMKREIASLSFSDTSKSSEQDEKNPFGLRTFVLHALRRRTRLVLESVTNHVDGQACRLAYDLLQLLESRHLDRRLLVDSSSGLSPS